MASGAYMSRRKRLKLLKLIRVILHDWRTARKQVEIDEPEDNAMIDFVSLRLTMKDFPWCLHAHFIPELNRWSKFYYYRGR